MLCSVAVSGVMLPTVPDLTLKGKKRIQAWKEVADTLVCVLESV